MEATAEAPGAEAPAAEETAAEVEASGRPVGRLRGWLARIPPHWRFVLGLFLGAKVVVTLAAVLSLHAFDQIGFERENTISHYPVVSMWFPFDGRWYVDLVNGPWLGSGANLVLQFCFPPLYPLLGKAVAPVVGGDARIALLLISNVALLLLLYYAYRLGERLWGDTGDARRLARYVVLLPTAFIFQAGLTESLFLCLVVACFYYAECRRWLLTGILGFFAALTRSIGFLIVVPLVLLLLQQGGYRLNLRALGRYARTGWALVLVPGGWLTFMAYSRLRTGDWLRYNHLQQSRWGITLSDPLTMVWNGLVHGGVGMNSMRLWIAVGYLLLMAVGLRYLKPAYVVCGLIFTLMPLSLGATNMYQSLLRYLLVVFPVAMLFARWARRPTVDTYLTATLALLQGVLLVTWVISYTKFII